MSNFLYKPPEPNLNIYCQNKSLLFQFILAEFLTSFQKVQKIEEHYEKMEILLIKQRFSGNVNIELKVLLELLPTLTGSQMVVVNEQTFPWTHGKGSLNKLRHYCYLFAGASGQENPDIINMNICASKAFHSALQSREVLFSLQRENLEKSHVPSYMALYQFLDKMIDNMQRISRIILRLLFRCKEDENVCTIW